ncbi:MAG: DUF1800 domain-containing protein [Planctomycetes bacterium]|nr:DUF1800 domain-containing protein [Planctomycetota bacterium]
MNPLAPYEPSARDPFDLRKCGHLLRRAGFGASLPERQRLVREGLAAALQHVAPPLAEVPAADALLNEAIAFGSIERVRAFRVWLALQNTHPLRERLSYFWHGHFATSNSKVQDPRAMALMMATFDRLGTGRFDELLTAMLRDPALLRWLDNDVNTSKQPNENLAREVFELFALGRGNYSERDIKEAARALTGWHVRDGQFFRAGYLHDDGDKEVLGVRGKLDGDDVAAIAAARPESARFLAERWLRFFVHPQPERDEIDALAGAYEQHGRDVGATLRVLLGSRLFFSARAYRSKIKSPADFVIGSVRLIGGRAQPTALVAAMATLGETWLEPPSVEGWHGELAWLSPAAWLLRSNFVADLLAGRRGKLAPRAAELLRGYTRPDHLARAASLFCCDGDLSADASERLLEVARAAQGDRAATVLHAATCLPEYQLL